MMKNILKLTMLVFAVVAATACYDNKRDGKPASQGSPYEVIVVCNQNSWESPLGDTVRNVMGDYVKVINNNEPMYTVHRVMPNAYDGIIAKHRNLMLIQVGKDYKEPRMTAEYNVNAVPQIVVHMTGPDNRSVAEFVGQHAHELQQIFEIAERDRTISQAVSYGDKSISEAVEQLFGFSMSFIKGYRIRNTIADKHFMWISNEHPLASQGVVIYSYPYSGTEDFKLENLVARRNEFVALIPGENPGSHMITADIFTPEIKYLRIKERNWAEMRGFWDVKSDFMGGPFVSYSTIDAEKGRVVTVDFYLYSPDKPKRNLLRQLEHLIYTVSFPGVTEQ